MFTYCLWLLWHHNTKSVTDHTAHRAYRYSLGLSSSRCLVPAHNLNSYHTKKHQDARLERRVGAWRRRATSAVFRTRTFSVKLFKHKSMTRREARQLGRHYCNDPGKESQGLLLGDPRWLPGSWLRHVDSKFPLPLKSESQALGRKDVKLGLRS